MVNVAPKSAVAVFPSNSVQTTPATINGFSFVRWPPADSDENIIIGLQQLFVANMKHFLRQK